MTSGERCDVLHPALLPPRPAPRPRPAFRPAAARSAVPTPPNPLRHRRGGDPRCRWTVLAILSLLGAGVAGSCYLVPWLAAGGLERLDLARFTLKAGKSSPMLRDTSATAPPAPKRPAPTKDLDRPHSEEPAAAPVLPTPTAEPPRIVPPVARPPATLPVIPGPVQLAAASDRAEAADSDTCVTPRGVSPMLRNWRTFVLPTFVIAALVTPAAVAGEAGANKDRLKPIQEQLESMKKSLDKAFHDVGTDMAELRKQLATLRDDRKTLELSLQNQIADLKTDLDALKKRLPADLKLYPAMGRGDLAEIRSKLAQMEHTLSKLQAPPRVSLAAPGPQTGRVVLVNTYSSEMLFIVNGQSHNVAPGQTLTLEGLPAGAINYEAISNGWGVVRRSSTSLAANETLTLVAR